jgi:hypothetical protein
MLPQPGTPSTNIESSSSGFAIMISPLGHPANYDPIVSF